MKNNTEKEFVILSDVILMEEIDKDPVNTPEEPKTETMEAPKAEPKAESKEPVKADAEKAVPVKNDNPKEQKNASGSQKKKNRKKSAPQKGNQTAAAAAGASVDNKEVKPETKPEKKSEKKSETKSNGKNKAKGGTEDKKSEEKNTSGKKTEEQKPADSNKNVSKKKQNKGKKGKKNAKKQNPKDAKPLNADEMLAIASAELSKTISGITQAEAEFEKANAELSKGIAEIAKAKAIAETEQPSKPEEAKESKKAKKKKEKKEKNQKKESKAEVDSKDSEVSSEQTDTESKKKITSFKEFMQNDKYVFIAGIAILVVMLYSCMVYNYRDMFFLGTTINGLKCENMTVEEAEVYFREEIESYALEIAFRDGSTGVIPGTAFDYKYVSDGSIAKLMEKQNSLFWFFALFAPPTYEIPETIEFDRSKLASEYYALESTSAEKKVLPSNACVTYEGDKFVVKAEDEGNDINHHKLIMVINEAVDAGVRSIEAEEYEVYARPTVFVDNPTLYTQCDQLNEIAAVSITYTIPGGEFVLDGNVVKTWLQKDDQGNYSVTEEEMETAIAEFVDEFAKEINTVKTERPFHATKQGDITVSGGSYGWKIDEKEEERLIAEAIANHTIETREPVYTSREVTIDNHGFGDTYIEIDLTNQMLWYYVEGELYVESNIVSGTYYAADRKTPPGIFLLTYKQRDKVLRGQQREDGTYEYESPVTFWMPFNRGIGLHDATWRGSFGGSIYKYSGSHGCINLPYKKAEAIYAQIDKTTPIILYY